MYQFTYITAVFIVAIVWLLLFLNKPYRKEMLVMSFVFAPYAILDLIFIRDYWNPLTFLGGKFGIETFLFAFFIGGIASVIYEEFRRAKLVRSIREPGWILFGFGSILLVTFLGVIYSGLNSIYALFAVYIFGALFIANERSDLISDMLGSALTFGLLSFFLYLVWIALFPGVIQSWWKLENISGILVFGVPLEEILFAFGFGMVAGPLYELWQGYRLKISK